MSEISKALKLLDQGEKMVSQGNAMIARASKIFSESYRTQEEESSGSPRPNGLSVDETQNVLSRFRKNRFSG